MLLYYNYAEKLTKNSELFLNGKFSEPDFFNYGKTSQKTTSISLTNSMFDIVTWTLLLKIYQVYSAEKYTKGYALDSKTTFLMRKRKVSWCRKTQKETQTHFLSTICFPCEGVPFYRQKTVSNKSRIVEKSRQSIASTWNSENWKGTPFGANKKVSEKVS